MNQVSCAAKMVKDLYPRGMPDPVQPTHGIAAFLRSQKVLNQGDLRYQVFQCPGRIKEASSSGDNQLWNPCDCRRDHDSAARHGFHQDKRNSFAATGKNEQISLPV